MRALRRATLAYWYATIEDKQASLIEATTACLAVNVLDESVFELELGDAYRKHRADSPGGRVVTGLELVRNCETHSPVSFDDLVVTKRGYGVPLNNGAQVMRSVWHWADYASLPSEYVDLTGKASEKQKRARKEAQHGYRSGVQGRSVVETLLDAEKFFSEIEPRLKASLGPRLTHSFAEVPQGGSTVLHRPLEGFVGTVSLPDLATRWDERTTAAEPSADQRVKALATGRTRDLPTADRRTITHKISDEGRVVGFSGHQLNSIVEMNWVERSAQIGRDIRGGFRYIVETASGEVPVMATENLDISANADTQDLLFTMDEAPEERGLSRLRLVEEYPDLYLSMRKGH
jgi:hypothetical protein